MAVTQTTLQLTDNGQWEGETAEGYERTYRTNWLVVTNDKLDGPQIVMAAPGLPSMYSTYAAGNDVDTAARLVKKTPKLKSRSATGNAWVVTCDYTTAADSNQSQQDPTERPPTISGSFVQFMRPLEKDTDGEPVVNTVGDPFDPPIEVEDSRPVLTIVKFFSSLDFVFFCSYKDVINSDTFTVRSLSFAPDVCKMQNLSFNEQWINGINYFQVTAEMEIKPEKWIPKEILNQGYRVKWPDADGKLQMAKDDKSGEPLNTPVLINEDGTQRETIVRGFAANQPPHYVQVKAYVRRPFALLNLG